MKKKKVPNKKKKSSAGGRSSKNLTGSAHSRSAKASLSLTSLEVSLTSVWPQERDVIIRPDRLKYVRKMIKTEGCVFCESAKQGVSAESLCVYKDRHAMLILNKFPYNTGHIMVLPTRHCGDLTELSDEEYMHMQTLLKKVVTAIKKEYQVAGMNVGLNMGHIAGAGIPEHLHWHVIPRWMGDTNFFPLIAETKVLPESLEDTYQRYRKYFS